MKLEASKEDLPFGPQCFPKDNDTIRLFGQIVSARSVNNLFFNKRPLLLVGRLSWSVWPGYNKVEDGRDHPDRCSSSSSAGWLLLYIVYYPLYPSEYNLQMATNVCISRCLVCRTQSVSPTQKTLLSNRFVIYKVEVPLSLSPSDVHLNGTKCGRMSTKEDIFLINNWMRINSTASEKRRRRLYGTTQSTPFLKWGWQKQYSIHALQFIIGTR